MYNVSFLFYCNTQDLSTLPANHGYLVKHLTESNLRWVEYACYLM